MKANKGKLGLAMARACMNAYDIAKKANLPQPTINNVISGRNVKPKTLGSVCVALGVDVAEIIEEES